MLLISSYLTFERKSLLAKILNMCFKICSLSRLFKRWSEFLWLYTQDLNGTVVLVKIHSRNKRREAYQLVSGQSPLSSFLVNQNYRLFCVHLEVDLGLLLSWFNLCCCDKAS